MKIRYQTQVWNNEQVQKVLREGKKEHLKPVEALHEAAVMAGEFIARKNNHKSVTVEEVIKTYRPKYLEER